jgi:uncharacterized membrane protein (UPF0127 family)
MDLYVSPPYKVVELRINKKRLCEIKHVSPFIGLMFQRPRPVYFSVPNSHRPSLHMWFVFGSIDVLFLSSNRVVDVKRGFKPFRCYTSKAIADTVVELQAGMARDVKMGDVVTIS